MIKRLTPFFLIGLFLSACSHYKVVSAPETHTQIYPNGTYQHQVSITMPQGKRQSFQGVVSLTPQEILVVGLSAFGTTLFRLKDDFSPQAPSVEIFIDPLRKHEEKLRQFYGLLRKLLLLPSSGKTSDSETPSLDAQGRLLSTTLASEGKKTVLTFSEYDEHSIPRRIHIEAEKFSVDIEVTGYEI